MTLLVVVVLAQSSSGHRVPPPSHSRNSTERRSATPHWVAARVKPSQGDGAYHLAPSPAAARLSSRVAAAAWGARRNRFRRPAAGVSSGGKKWWRRRRSRVPLPLWNAAFAGLRVGSIWAALLGRKFELYFGPFTLREKSRNVLDKHPSQKIPSVNASFTKYKVRQKLNREYK